MELLSETTIDSTLHRVSTAGQTLAHYWEPMISAYTPVRVGLPEVYGGYACPKWGSRSFSPDLFVDDWPPPKSIDVVDYITDSDEASNVLVFKGKLHLDSYNESEVTYQAYGDDYDTMMTSSRTYSGSLISVFTTYCGASYLNLTLDSSDASAKTVNWSTSGERALIDDLSDIAAFFCHAFYIKDGTLYLVDITVRGGTPTLTTFDHFKGYSVEASPPISVLIADGERLTGSHEYGQEVTISPVCSTTSADIQTQLGIIRTHLEYSYFRVRATPETANMVNIADIVSVYQDSMLGTGLMHVIVTDIAIDIARSEILIEGVGVDYAT